MTVFVLCLFLCHNYTVVRSSATFIPNYLHTTRSNQVARNHIKRALSEVLAELAISLQSPSIGYEMQKAEAIVLRIKDRYRTIPDIEEALRHEAPQEVFTLEWRAKLYVASASVTALDQLRKSWNPYMLSKGLIKYQRDILTDLLYRALMEYAAPPSVLNDLLHTIATETIAGNAFADVITRNLGSYLDIPEAVLSAAAKTDAYPKSWFQRKARLLDGGNTDTQEPYLYAVAPLPTHVQVGPATVDAINAYLARIASAITDAFESPDGELRFQHVVQLGGSIRDVLHLELAVHGDRVSTANPSH
jgi:hypothetical protein